MADYLFYPLLSAIILLVLAMAFSFFFGKDPRYEKPAKIALFVASVLFGVTALTVAVFSIRAEWEGNMHPIYFYPLLISLFAIAAALSFYAFARKRHLYEKAAKITLLSVFSAAAVALLVCFSIYYTESIAPDGYYESVNSLWLIVGAVGIVVLLVLLAWAFGRPSDKRSETRSVTYGAICLALSFGLSFIRLFKLPQGGSITLVSLLPIMLYSQMFGVRKGVFVGFIYGILQAIQDPWIIHPAQFLLDYPIAFACIGLSAIFTRGGLRDAKGVARFATGSVFAVILRYFSHVISGIFAFSMYAGEGYGAVAWGFLYNTFALADMAIALAVGVIMLGNSAFRKLIDRVSDETRPREVGTAGEGAPSAE